MLSCRHCWVCQTHVRLSQFLFLFYCNKQMYQYRCDDKESCDLVALQGFTGISSDPCPGEVKKLNVEYECIGVSDSGFFMAREKQSCDHACQEKGQFCDVKQVRIICHHSRRIEIIKTGRIVLDKYSSYQIF